MVIKGEKNEWNLNRAVKIGNYVGCDKKEKIKRRRQ